MVGSTLSWFRSRWVQSHQQHWFEFKRLSCVESTLSVYSKKNKWISGQWLQLSWRPQASYTATENRTLVSLLLHNLAWPYFKTLYQLSFHVPWLMAKLGFFHTASGNWTCVGSVAPPGVTWTQYALPTEQPKHHHRRKRCTRKRQPQQAVNLKA